MYSKDFRPLEETIKFIEDNKILSHTEWKLYVECSVNHVEYYNYEYELIEPLPKDIQANIPHVFRENNIIYPKKHTKTNFKHYLPYEDCKNFIQPYGFKCYKDWLNFLMMFRKDKKPIIGILPLLPDAYYRETGEWYHWADFLNIKAKDVNKIDPDNFDRLYVSYEDAKYFARSLKIKSQYEWMAYESTNKDFYNSDGRLLPKKPLTFPKSSNKYYQKIGEWISWQDFLGYEDSVYYSLDYLKHLCRINHIKSKDAWYNYARLNNYPINVNFVYHYNWISWWDFLDKEQIEYSSLNDIKQLLYNKNFKTLNEYKAWWMENKPKNMPKHISIYMSKQEDYDYRKYFNLSVSEKLSKEHYDKLFYICYDDMYMSNLISVSVELNGKANAMMNIKNKNQRLIGMYSFDDFNMVKKIIGKYCVKYLDGMYNNQYLCMNIFKLIEDVDELFENV